MRWEEIRQEWFADQEFSEAFERDYPYHELSLEIGGLRADLGMTQTEFGRLLGAPQSTVARLESGRQAPSVATLTRIARATGAELVIEFRRPKHKRRAKQRIAAASSAGDSGSTERVAAFASDD